MSRLHGLGQQKPDPALSKVSRLQGEGGASCQGLREVHLLCSASVLSFHYILDLFPAREEMPQGGLVWCYSSVFTMYGPCNL